MYYVSALSMCGMLSDVPEVGPELSPTWGDAWEHSSELDESSDRRLHGSTAEDLLGDISGS